MEQVQMDGVIDEDQLMLTTVLTTKVINDILDNDTQDIYRLV
jgi:hypothetical protein